MPWCEPCARYFAPSAMCSDGSCPACGRPVGTTTGAAPRADPVTADSLDLRALARAGRPGSEKVPWHFALLMVMLVAYLGWRLVAVFL